MNKVVHMSYSSSLSSLCEKNSSFDTGVLRIAYHGKNRNGSYISKETFERCIDTMYNCPIVCNYDRETDSIGGHDMELVSNENGDLKIVNVTVPVGVIPESSKHFWSVVEEEDGTTNEYLCADILVWKRQEAYNKIKEDGITSHSMELTVKDGEMENGVFVIKDFEFTAFCLLGEDHEPCFESSALGLFAYDELKQQMAQMMAELKETFTSVTTPDGDDNTHPHIISTEGGEKVLEEKLALVAEYGLDADNLEFSIEEFSLEELKEKLEMEKAKEPPVEPTEEPADPVEEPTVVQEFELNSQMCEEIRCAIEAETVERSWGKMPRYSIVDYDADTKMVYCFDADDHWRLYGFTFSMNGDNVVVDFESKKRMKFAIVDFDEGEQVMPFDSIFDQISTQYTANDTQWSEKYQTASDTIASMEDELGTLRQFKTDTEKAANDAARDEVFAQFEDLVGVEEFETLRENCENYELDTLEEKCFAIRGRHNTTVKYSMNTKNTRIVVDKTAPTNEPYGGLFVKYPPKM